MHRVCVQGQLWVFWLRRCTKLTCDRVQSHTDPCVDLVTLILEGRLGRLDSYWEKMSHSGPAPSPDIATLPSCGERKKKKNPAVVEYVPVTEVELGIFTFIIKALIKNNRFSLKKAKNKLANVN